MNLSARDICAHSPPESATDRFLDIEGLFNKPMGHVFISHMAEVSSSSRREGVVTDGTVL